MRKRRPFVPLWLVQQLYAGSRSPLVPRFLLRRILAPIV